MTDTDKSGNASDSGRGVIKTTRAAAAAFNGVAATVLRDVTQETDGSVFNDKTPQVLALVDGREHYFYADEIAMGDKEADAAKVRPDFLPDRLRHPGTPDQAAWDAAEKQSTVQSMEQYLLSYPMGVHAQEARLRRSQIGPGLPPLPPLPKAMTDNMPGQSPAIAKDEDRNTPSTGNHPEYDLTEDQRKSMEANKQGGMGTGTLSGQPRATQQADESAWSVAQSQNTIAGYDRYMAQYPASTHADEARKRRATLAG